MLPVLDLLLVNYRKLVEPQYWKLTWRRIPLHLVRVTFAVAALVTVSLDGLDSAFLYWKGTFRILQTFFSGCLFLKKNHK